MANFFPNPRIRRAAGGLLLAVVVAAAAAAQPPPVQWPGDTNLNWTPPPGMSSVPSGPNATLGAPVFDPFATGPSPGFQSPAPVVTPDPNGSAWPVPSVTGGPLFNGSEPFPSQGPPSLFPNGIGTSGVGLAGPSMRFLQAPRFRYGWLSGDTGKQLQINEFDFSLAFAWPNFLFSSQPLYLVPSFSLQLWDGPKAVPPGKMADLPPQAYGAFLDTGWESSPESAVGAEVGTRIGVFSDFNTLTTESLRIQGKGLLRLRATPTVQLRGGVYYIDRVKVKLLPAGGILWTPNPQTRFDLYFPSPKLAQYLTTVGNTEVWWYVAGEYGGGTWTIERAASGLSDQVDLNDIRVILGTEWGPSRLFLRGRRVGFFEAAWVTSRQVRYRGTPVDDINLDDTFMLRAGVAY